MNLLPDWRRLVRRAWSLRLIEMAAAADLILNVVPFVSDQQHDGEPPRKPVVPFVSDWLPWWLTIVLLAGAWGARLIAQPEKEKAIGNQQDPAVEAG